MFHIKDARWIQKYGSYTKIHKKDHHFSFSFWPYIWNILALKNSVSTKNLSDTIQTNYWQFDFNKAFDLTFYTNNNENIGR